MDPRRIIQLTGRIESAGDQIIGALQRVESALADRTAVEIDVVGAEVVRPDGGDEPGPGRSTTGNAFPVRSAPSPLARWRRAAFIAGAAFLGGLALRRLGRRRRRRHR